MSIEPSKTKKKSFLAEIFGELPVWDDLEKTSTETKHTQDHQHYSATIAVESTKKVAARSPPSTANKERQDSPHVTPPQSSSSLGLSDFEKRKIKEKKSAKFRRNRLTRQATMSHKDRSLESVDDVGFGSLLDSYTQHKDDSH